MEKFTADEKVAIVMESFTSNNISELCRRHGVSVASFYKLRDKFIESGKKGFYESGRSGEMNTRRRIKNCPNFWGTDQEHPTFHSFVYPRKV